MIDGTFFDKLVSGSSASGAQSLTSRFWQEEIARIMRKNKHPFGGIQVR
jgi:hypothetical protein